MQARLILVAGLFLAGLTTSRAQDPGPVGDGDELQCFLAVLVLSASCPEEATITELCAPSTPCNDAFQIVATACDQPETLAVCTAGPGCLEAIDFVGENCDPETPSEVTCSDECVEAVATVQATCDGQLVPDEEVSALVAFCATGGAVKARNDPHLHLAHGARADFRGEHNKTFAVLSAKDVAFNVKFLESDFRWNKRIVHGTKMSAAYWVIRTSSGKLVKIEYEHASKSGALAQIEGGNSSIAVRSGAPAVVIDNVLISMSGKTVTVTVLRKWRLSATVAPFPFGSLNRKKVLININIEPLYDAAHDAVAPHGIIGQSFDGDDVGVDGKRDLARAEETTTEAQAEGAIEGNWRDYLLSSNFATDFKYSRFDATSAAPRDVSSLTGEKHAYKPASVANGKEAHGDFVGSSDSEDEEMLL
uniref:VWFD domain-containing protein n=1 Tax=Chrysotila carterae TaxID=13221 RepID=A0A7S4BUE4_CHRCT|mmetsp:Transcript_22835/g.49900  ORF Transcript_22835/g.49900 Transcript_22835/m.49900 type:complete len:419 (+) Transcript_22835:201-1457(+)